MDIRPDFSVVWLKRDFRLRDHAPLCAAINREKPVLLLYIVEPEMLDDPHMDIRHWRFIFQSISDMNEQLRPYHGNVEILSGTALHVFTALKEIGTFTLYSHQEIGLEHTFQRDIKVSSWCKLHQIHWHEYETGAVKRPLTHRFSWRKHWHESMFAPIQDPQLSQLQTISFIDKLKVLRFSVPETWHEKPTHFQLGGEKRAWHALKDFFKERGKAYFGNIGDPTTARKTCSRLSPYLAWGNISIRQTVQYTQAQPNRQGWSKSISAFSSRLAWHCHFIQKFESEHAMQWRPVNYAYLHYQYAPLEITKTRLEAWQNGTTGIPIIDASMRAVIATGYLNFRMRAMLVSFLCHHLNIDWRLGVQHLARCFLDYEPGIHYPQFQMQAGVTGTNIIRMYNPIKQGKEKDPNGEFIRRWVPELSALPTEFIHEPSRLPPIDAALLNFDITRDYLEAIVDIESAAKEARERLWTFRERDDVKKEAKRILRKHSVLN